MKCEYYRELISARLDSELQPDELETLEAHLEKWAPSKFRSFVAHTPDDYSRETL